MAFRGNQPLSTTWSLDFNVFLFENDFLALFPELFLLSAAIILLTAGVLLSTSALYSRPILLTNWSWLALYSLALTTLLIWNSPLNEGYLFYNCLVMDPMTLFFKKLLISGTFITICISMEYNRQERLNQFEYMVLLLVSTTSMLFMIQSADCISMYLAIELQSLCFYVLAALKWGNPFSSEAGVKYFLLGAFSSGILLFGCSLIYGFTGLTEFANLSKILSCGAEDFAAGDGQLSTFFSGLPLRGCELGMIFLLVALLFKITAVPFHLWAPDVYEGAHTTVTAFFSFAPKIALICLMIRLFGCADFYFPLSLQKILILSSCASMILGSFAAMSQNKIKRLLAFSSIGHVGYMLVSLSLDSLLGVQALCVYICVYVVMTASLFSTFLLTLGCGAGAPGANGGRLKYITDLTQLAVTHRPLAACLTVTLFSMAGIPPLAGFYAKAGLFLAALGSAQYFLAVVGVLTSVVSCYYYIRLVKIMYFEKSPRWLSLNRVEKSSSLSLSFCFVFSGLFLVYPAPLYLAAHWVSANAF